jgi:hypothetical protein
MTDPKHVEQLVQAANEVYNTQALVTSALAVIETSDRDGEEEYDMLFRQPVMIRQRLDIVLAKLDGGPS